MNVTLVINLAATLGMGVAVWLAGTGHQYGPFYALGLAYVSGLLTAVSSQYHIAVKPDGKTERGGANDNSL